MGTPEVCEKQWTEKKENTASACLSISPSLVSTQPNPDKMMTITFSRSWSTSPVCISVSLCRIWSSGAAIKHLTSWMILTCSSLHHWSATSHTHTWWWQSLTPGGDPPLLFVSLYHYVGYGQVELQSSTWLHQRCLPVHLSILAQHPAIPRQDYDSRSLQEVIHLFCLHLCITM